MNTPHYHRLIDELLVMANNNSEKKSCCGRCTYAYCCDEPAYCDADEVAYMLETMSPEQRAEVKERTLEWYRRFTASPFLEQDEPRAFAYRLMNLPCPFLTPDKRCSAYANRPADCRMFMALGEPEGCAMPARMKQPIADFPKPNPFDRVMEHYFISKGYVEIDHIGAHLVRQLGIDPNYTTAAHRRVEIEKE